MQKLVIANRGSKEQGKSTSIREVFNILAAKYASGNEKDVYIDPTNVYIDYGDIMATIQIGDVLVGLESQGDPGSRIFDSLKKFVDLGCDIIVCACRSYGDTTDAVYALANDGYQVILAQNDKSDDEAMQAVLNKKYATRVVDMIEERIRGDF